MKKNYLEKIKLNKFSNAELEQRKLNALNGGCNCRYGCNYTCMTFWEVAADGKYIVQTTNPEYIHRY